MANSIGTAPCERCRSRGADRRGDNRILYDDGGWHCFACGDHYGGPIFNKLFGVKNDDILSENKALLPNDAKREIPRIGIEWLRKFGFTPDSFKDKLFYSPGESRLYFLCGDPPVCSIGRDLSGTSKRKWLSYGPTHDTPILLGDIDNSPAIVLVEDWLSATKISQVCATISLFGTNIFDGVFNVLRLYKKPVIIWLDQDQLGRLPRLAMRLRIVSSLPVCYTTTHRDPKLCSYSEISNQINASLTEIIQQAA